MLDFRMKHEGEPPARLVAQLRVTMKAKGIPTAFVDPLAEVLAPVMTSADELDTETLTELTVLAEFLARKGVPPTDALDKLKDLVADLITEGTVSPQDGEGEAPKAKLNLLARMMNRIYPPGPVIRNNPPRMTGGETPGRTAEALADALAGRINRRHTPTIGARYVGMSLGEMFMLDCQARGLRPRNTREAIRMASHSISDFPGITENALGKAIAREMEQITPALAQAAHEIPAEDYHGGKLLALSASGMPQEVEEAGEFKHVTIDEMGETKPVPRLFGSLFRVTEKVLVNDNTGLFLNGVAKQMIAGATERFRHVLLEPLKANGGTGNLMSDGKPVFHADHGNLAGTGSPLNIDSLSDARMALRSQRGPQGEYLAIEPWALVVPPALETTAQKLLAELNPATVNDANPFSGTLQLIVEPGLSDSNAWYLIGDPGRVDGLAYAFLDGETAPRVEAKEGWNVPGMEYRLIWNLDARFVNWRSWFKNPGTGA